MWRKCGENSWEVLLTHSQMFGLADIVDMYYADFYTLPHKELFSGVTASSTNLSNKKTGSLLKFISVSLASAILLIAISVLGQFGSPYLHKGGKYLREGRYIPSSQVETALNQCSDAVKLEALCGPVDKKIKDSLGWPGEITSETNVGAWTGKVPDYLRMAFEDHSNTEDVSTISTPLDKIDEDLKASAQDIASYQA